MRSPRYSLISLAVTICAVLTVLVLDQYGKGSRVFGAFSGPITDARIEKVIVPTPVDAYNYWKGKGFKGRRMLFIADKWDRFDPAKFDELPLYRAYPLSFYNLGAHNEAKFLDDQNFLYMAAINGVFRQINALLSVSGHREASLHAAQAKDMRFENGGEIYQPFLGFPRYYSNIETFRPGNEPVLLYISASYFKEMDPDVLFDRLIAAGVVTDSVVLCNSMNDNTVSDTERQKLKRFGGLIADSGRGHQRSALRMSAGGGDRS